MARATLTKRVEDVEFAVQELQKLPPIVNALENKVGAIEGQILQLRAEMRGEFSALRQEMRALHDEQQQGLRDAVGELRGELRGEIADARNQARILHEEVIDRIALLGEKVNGPRTRKKRTQ